MSKSYRVTLSERLLDPEFRAAWEEEHKFPTCPETPEELDVLLRESMPDVHMGHYVSSKAVFYKMRAELEKSEMRIKDCEYAPQVVGYVDMLKSNNYSQWGNAFAYDEKTYEIIDCLFEVLEKIKPEVSYGRKIWNLWLRAERGPIEAYGDYQEMKEYEEVDTYEDYEDLWQELYPEEVSWYSFMAIVDPDINYRTIFMCHKQVIEVDQRKERGYPHDIAPFAQWMLDGVQACLEELKAGTYNQKIENELPAIHRTGTIPRRALWDIFPDWRKDFFEGFSREELEKFQKYVEEKDPEDRNLIGRLKELTANAFYQFCAMGYRANNYSGGELSPKDWYYRHADGRDEGLREIAPDSPEAFARWYHDRDRGGVHPWEVCRGGNSTHVRLQVCADDDGYYLLLAGSAWTRCVETIRFYLTLREAGLPVVLHEGRGLLARMLEEDKIGIVPNGIWPTYCEGLFPGEAILDLINLPDEKQDEVVKYCSWYPEPTVELESK